MKTFIIRCLQGTSSTPTDIQVVAPNFDAARQVCREYGFVPVQQCAVYSSAA